MTLTHLDLDRIDGLAGRLRESGTKNAPRNSNGVYMSICDEAADDITALITRIRELEADKARLDWLEQHTVNVRDPLVYGSRDMFWAGPHTEDGITDPSDLRAQIDTALQRKTP